MVIESNIEINKVYQADMDMIVTAQLDASDGGRSTVSIIRIDENGNEFRMATASVHFYTASDAWVNTNTATTLIKKGNRYKIEHQQSHPSTIVHAYWEAI